MRTGLVNMGLGVLIATVGVLVTAFSYSMVSQSGGTYVVATGAFVVGAWRFVLGVFQLLRDDLGTPETEKAAISSSSLPTRAYTSASVDSQGAAKAFAIIGGVLIADSVLRLIFLGLLLWRVPTATIFNSLPLLLTGIVVPAALLTGAAVAGSLLLRNRQGAITFGLGVCTIGLLYQAYVLVKLLSASTYHVPWFTWALFVVHFAVYVMALIVLVIHGRRKLSVPSPA